MQLSEKEKKKIEEEEAYRAELRERENYRAQIRGSKSQPQKKGISKGVVILIAVLSIPIILAVALLAVNPAKQYEKSETNHIANITPFPAMEIANKTEDEIKSEYSSILTNYSSVGLTPSQKVKITGFDLEKANIQIDYDVNSSIPVYIGYSYSSNPLPEEEAWKITGFSKPTVSPEENPGIMNRTVYVWENISDAEPFKMIQDIYEADGKVSKIAFSKEDLNTAKSSSSLYYVHQ